MHVGLDCRLANESFLWCVRKSIKLERFMHVRHLRPLWHQMTFIGGVKVIYPKSRMTSLSIWQLSPKPTVRTDGNTSNKMSDILSDIKYTVPYTPSTCRCHSALEIFLKNINKKMNKKCHWNASSNFWKFDWFMGRFFVLTYFEIWMLQICVYTYVYPR